MLSLWAFTALVVIVSGQRLAELSYSRRNERRLRARGAVEHVPWQVPMLALLHGAWLCSMLVEVWLRRPVVDAPVALVALAAFFVGQALRLTAIRTLGDRWTVRVLTLPATPRVRGGLYRWLPHPNYLGVAIEIVALPLVHGAVLTAVVFSGLNAAAMVLRISAEARALAEAEP